MKRRTRILWIMALCALNVLVGACITASQAPAPADSSEEAAAPAPESEEAAMPAAPVKRGIKFGHAFHMEQGLDCAMCHDMIDGVPAMPSHDVCSACHDINVDEPSPEQCGLCHVDPDYAVEPRVSSLHPDLKFQHDPHIAREIECAVCHENPDERALVDEPLKPFCMDCHGKTDAALNECAVCHTDISRDTIPQFRKGARIQHDAPQIWTQIHGRESQVDPQYCAMCHDQEQSCDTCHQTTAPADHTVSWRRKTHGIKASWDRSNCTVCHEEESCLQCHRNTEPVSHRQGWGEPLNRHCTSCHFPPDQTKCIVCHETVEHPSGKPSPHRLSIYPPNCIKCHPGGVSGRAPHPTNSTTRCQFCH